MAVVWSSDPESVYSRIDCVDGLAELSLTETSRFEVGARRSSRYSRLSRDRTARRRGEGRVGIGVSGKATERPRPGAFRGTPGDGRRRLEPRTFGRKTEEPRGR